MAMGSPEWIEESLARLESMEQARDEHEKALEATTDANALRMHSESIDRLDEEIKQLYAALEAVAEEDDEEEPDEVDEVIRTSPFEREGEATAEPEPEPEPAPEPAPMAAAPPEDLPDDPFGAPAPAPMAAAAAASSGFPDPAPMVMDTSFDEPKSGGAGKWIVLVVLLAGGGVGGFMFLKNNPKPPPAPAAPVEQRVIEATAIPEDTQGPQGAKGQDGVTRTPDREFGKSGGRRGGGGGGRSSGGSSGGKKSNGKAIELKAGDDPLG